MKRIILIIVVLIGLGAYNLNAQEPIKEDKTTQTQSKVDPQTIKAQKKAEKALKKAEKAQLKAEKAEKEAKKAEIQQ